LDECIETAEWYLKLPWNCCETAGDFLEWSTEPD
jgi:hypothetical protein